MGRAGPPPAPLPDPSPSIPLHQPSSISASLIPSLSSDLVSDPDLPSISVLAPDLSAANSSGGQFSSDHPPPFHPSRRRTSFCTRSSGLAAVSSRFSSLAAVRTPDLSAAGPFAGLPSSDQHLFPQSPLLRASSSSRSSSIPLSSSAAVQDPPAAVLSASAGFSAAAGSSAAAGFSAAAGSSAGPLSSAQALPLQHPLHPAPSSPSSSCPAANRAAAGSTSAAVPPQIASVLPLLASVLQSPATSLAIPSSSSLPPPLDTPQCSAAAQDPVPIGSTPGARLNASTEYNSANPLPLPPPLHPPPPLSYAQVAKHSRGSGFVRSHAVDVESFARLPRTGAKIICGSKEGIPSFSFVNSDLQTVEHLYANALIMKFHGGRPSLEVSHREIQSWGLEHPFSIGPLSSRAFLLRFQDNKDLIRVLTRPSSILITFPYKVFRWHNLCHLKDDSCYAPVWISLPRLPLQCFIPEFLESVANRIGRFLCFDKATTTLARPSAARLCVELDLRITPPPFIWVGLFDGLKQPIIYEKMPKYCGECHIQGHLATTCPKGQRETPYVQAFSRSVINRACPPPARQNAVKRVPAPLHQPNTLAAPYSISQPPTQPNHLSTSAPSPSPLLNAEATRQQPLAAAHTSVPSPPLLLDPDEARHQHIPLHQPTYLQAEPTVSLLQRAPDATTSADDHLQAQPTAALLQHVHQAQSSAGLLQLAAAAAGPAVQAQPTDSLLQRDPATAAPAAGLDPLRQSTSLVQRISDSAAPSAAPSATLDPPFLSASPVQRVSVSAAPSFPPADPSVVSAHSSGLRASTMTHPSSTLHKGKQKSIKTKPPDVGTSSSLNQQQQEALELFKSKVLGQSRIRDHQTSVNHLEALRYDHSDDADDEIASYYSDTDDGCVEPIEMGYQSANGRSSNKHKSSAPSGIRINKRHPNMPLRVKLRSRKNSHPSTP